MKKLWDWLIGSLPIWAGIIVILLSFVLWDMQQRVEKRDLIAITSLQSKHVAQWINHEDHFSFTKLDQFLTQEPYQHFSFQLYQGQREIYHHGVIDEELKTRWSVSELIPKLDVMLVVFPNPSYFDERDSFLPFMAFLMGILVGVLLIMVGVLAHVASRRAKTIMRTNKKMREQLQEKQKLELVLQHNQKLQAIGTLAGGIAHDFNNILYAIMGYVQLAREDINPDSVAYQNLGKVLAASERGQKLIASILSFSHQQRPHVMKRVNLVALLQQVFILLDPGLPADITLEKQIHLTEAWVRADENSLEQVIMNMVNNAIDAMNRKGVIIIGLYFDDRFQSFCIRIQDTGSGMDAETKRRIFEPFFTTKPVGSGTGLGLSLAHGIIEEHRGRIEVDSEVGKGTTFYILLPKAQGEEHGKYSIG